MDDLVRVNKEYNSDFDCSSLSAGEVLCLDESDSTAGSPSTSSSDPSDPNSGSSSGGSSGGSSSSSSNSTSSTAATTVGCQSYTVPTDVANCTAVAASFVCNIAFTPSANQMYQFVRANPSINCMNPPIPSGTQVCINYVFATSSATNKPTSTFRKTICTTSTNA
ncbi:hypothetical protein DFJ73DRAFT_300632 [Zopfochytrium polystomum]|nr:hypothetical protein DFJ73DRAFT_300632 [Zopfochytrium polystomum]